MHRASLLQPAHLTTHNRNRNGTDQVEVELIKAKICSQYLCVVDNQFEVLRSDLQCPTASTHSTMIVVEMVASHVSGSWLVTESPPHNWLSLFCGSLRGLAVYGTALQYIYRRRPATDQTERRTGEDIDYLTPVPYS